MTKKLRIVFLLPSMLLLLLIINGCKPDDPVITESTGKIVLNFLHYCDGAPLVLDSSGYVNEAGNIYEVNELRYFISDVTLHKSDGKDVIINKENDIYYIDIDSPGTLKWQVFDPIPEGTYTGISFTFGLNQQKNQSFMYVNPPESWMVWPEHLGGGYHYLQMNGLFEDTPSVRAFNFHMGIGQIYPPNSHNYDSIISFVHNDFEVILPNSGFTLAKDQTLNIDVIMQIEEWFKNPNTWDHFIWSATMENQDALQAMKENGHNVFKVGTIQ